MSVYDRLRWLFFRLDAETAHNLAIRTLQPLPAGSPSPVDPALAVTVAGITFPSPIGLAAGFDKDAKAPGRMLASGFGSVEVGTVTPLPQPGNAAPRVFRLIEDEAVINRFGFNNEGHDAMERRLARRARTRKAGIVGVNLGANKDSADRIADYVLGVRTFSRYADYLTINISSPNTAGLRDLQNADNLGRLIDRVMAARPRHHAPPVFLKVSPDLDDNGVRSICRIALDGGIDALIVSNTTTQRPSSLQSSNARETGGLSGAPLKPIALAMLRAFADEVNGRLPLIGVGGIGSAADAYERIRAGASLVQLYTAIAYRGWGLASTMNDELVGLLRDDGLKTIGEAIGAERATTQHRPRQTVAA